MSSKASVEEVIRAATPGTQSREVQDYLFTFMPVLAEGLTELSMNRPTDAYAFLAAYLLRKSKAPDALQVAKALDEYLSHQKKALTAQSQPHSNGTTDAPEKPSAVAAVAAGTTEAIAPPSKPLHIIIAGAPCSGKGTQCELIKAQFNVVHISTGDLLRDAVAAGSDLGKEAKLYMDSGKLVPDSLIINLVKNKLSEPAAQEHGWLLDGFPRTFAQAEALRLAGIHPDLFLLLNVEDSLLIERVVGRRLDPVSGKIYHLKFDPPKEEEIINRLIQRSDDTEEKISVRLKAYHEAIEAIKKEYEKVMIPIDGNRSKNDIYADVQSNIKTVAEKK